MRLATVRVAMRHPTRPNPTRPAAARSPSPARSLRPLNQRTEPRTHLRGRRQRRLAARHQRLQVRRQSVRDEPGDRLAVQDHTVSHTWRVQEYR